MNENKYIVKYDLVGRYIYENCYGIEEEFDYYLEAEVRKQELKQNIYCCNIQIINIECS